MLSLRVLPIALAAVTWLAAAPPASAQCAAFGNPCANGNSDLLCITSAPPQIGTNWQFGHRTGCNGAMPSNMFTLFGGCLTPGIPVDPPIACASCGSCEWQAVPFFGSFNWIWPPRTVSLPIPNDPNLVGVVFCIQNVCTDGINPCVCLSNTLQVTIMP